MITVELGLALASVVAGLLQLAVCARRDTGALTIGLVGASLAWGLPDRVFLDALLGALGLYALAAALGTRWGVGRPAIGAAAVFVAAVCAVAHLYVAGPAPAVGSAVFGMLLTVGGLDRGAERVARPLWYRAVPVEVEIPNRVRPGGSTPDAAGNAT